MAYGTVPTHEDPVKAPTPKYTYTFAGWTPELAEVTGNATYKATFTASVNEYLITFKNADGTELQSGKVPYGTMPSYTGETPAKEADAQYSYVFTGWTPELAEVTGDATYTAVFESVLRTYTVTWKNWDGTVLETDENVPYGTMPTYDGEEPAKEGDAQFTYTFSGWAPAVETVKGDTVYTAQFENGVNTYTVTWKNWDGTVLETDENVPYGTMPTYDGTEPAREGNAQYSYAFRGWTPEIAAVSGSAVYTAEFTETVNTYTVTWKNWDGTVLETDENVPYGTMPAYDGAEPERAATAQYTYSFKGWTPAVETVKDNVSYTAEFTETVNTYTVTWKNWDGTVLETDENVPYGTTPSYDGAEPAREGNAQYSYAFKGWSPEVAAVSGSAVYTAEFTETVNTYTVTWKNWDGTVLETDESVPYGTVPTYDGETPVKAPDQDGHYGFTGWSPEIAEVTGAAVYTAVFAPEAHVFGEPAWTWTETADGYTASAEFACSCGYKQTVLAENVTYAVTAEPTAAADGEGVYTATVTGPDGKTWTGTKTVVIPKLQGWHINVTDYTKGAATTSIEAERLYSGEVTFTVDCRAACAVGMVNADGSITRLACATGEDGTHSFTVSVTDADVNVIVVIKGDANLDGKVKALDASMTAREAALRMAEQEGILNAVQAFAADVRVFGSIMAIDASFIAREAATLMAELESIMTW